MIPLIGAIGSAIAIGVEYLMLHGMEDANSQMEYLLDSIVVGASFEDFISHCWMILVLMFFLFWTGLSIAFPKRRRVSR